MLTINLDNDYVERLLQVVSHLRTNQAVELYCDLQHILMSETNDFHITETNLKRLNNYLKDLGQLEILATSDLS